MQTLPITAGVHFTKYQRGLARVRDRKPNMTNLESYGWHGTKGLFANQISKNGFDMSKTKSKGNKPAQYNQFD